MGGGGEVPGGTNRVACGSLRGLLDCACNDQHDDRQRRRGKGHAVTTRLAIAMTLWCGLTACAPGATGVAVTPDGTPAPTTGKIVSGTVKGGAVGATTKVALVGYFVNAYGQRLNALGQPATSDVLVSVPTEKDGKYGIDLPKPPLGPTDRPATVVSANLALVGYNDDNGNNQPDPGEARAFAAYPLSYAPHVGYSVIRPDRIQTDLLAFERIGITLD